MRESESWGDVCMCVNVSACVSESEVRVWYTEKRELMRFLENCVREEVRM